MNEENAIKFDVIIPVYNVEQYLVMCVESVLMQTYKANKIVLVNDGSTDGSKEICDRYANQFSHIEVIHKINEGLLKARRSGVEKSTGDYVLYLDSDDYWDTNLLSVINQYLEKTKASVALFRYKNVSNQGELIKESESVFEDGMVFDANNKDVLIDKMACTSLLNNVVCKAIERSIVLKEDGDLEQLNVTNGEDLCFSSYYISHASTIVYIDQGLYCYRYNPKSITNTFYLDQYNDILKTRAYFLKVLNVESYENISLLKAYKFILKLILIYASDLILSKNSRKVIVQIFESIQMDEFYQKIDRSNSFKKLPLRYKVRYHLFLKKRIRLYQFYEKIIYFSRGFKKPN